MKVNYDHKLWCEEYEGVVSVGMTKEYLEQIGTLWMFIPKTGEKVDEGDPCANLESTKVLATLRSPVKGQINWVCTLFDTPDLITSDTVLFQVTQ